MSETAGETAKKDVARFLHGREQEILLRWERLTEECVPSATLIPPEQWRDHVPLLIRRLTRLAEQLAEGQTPHREVGGGAPEAVALARLAQGLEFVQHLDELTLLRLAVTRLWRETIQAPTPEATEILEGLLDYLIRETAKRFADARERVLHALNRVADVGLGDPETQQFQRLVDVIVEEVPGADTVGLLVREGDTLRLEATVGLESERAKHAFAVRIGEGFSGKVAATGKPLLWREAQIFSGVKSEEVRTLGLRVLFGVPTPHAGEVLGVLHVGSRVLEDFTALALQVFTAVSDRVGVVIARQQEKAFRARMQVELLHERAQLTAILDAVPDGLIVYGREGELIQSNEWASTLLAHFTPEVTRPPVEERLSRWTVLDQDGNRIAPSMTPAERALRGEVVRSTTLRIEVPGSRELGLWLSVSAAPIRAPSGDVLGAVVTLTDVTALRRLQEYQQNLIRMVTHDLRTPLGAITMQADMLLRGQDPESLRRGRIIRTGAHQMDVMIKDLVDSARQETGQLVLNRRSIDLRTFVEDLKMRLEGVLAMDQIRTQTSEPLPEIWADPERLERILVNLIGNALKYSERDAPVTIECTAERGGVTIAIKDYGAGIEREALPHIFDRYYRAARTKGTEGLGLGLAITHMLVEAHGGEISVESAVGRGSTFRVWLPAESPRTDDAGDQATN